MRPACRNGYTHTSMACSIVYACMFLWIYILSCWLGVANRVLYYSCKNHHSFFIVPTVPHSGGWPVLRLTITYAELLLTSHSLATHDTLGEADLPTWLPHHLVHLCKNHLNCVLPISSAGVQSLIWVHAFARYASIDQNARLFVCTAAVFNGGFN